MTLSLTCLEGSRLRAIWYGICQRLSPDVSGGLADMHLTTEVQLSIEAEHTQPAFLRALEIYRAHNESCAICKRKWKDDPEKGVKHVDGGSTKASDRDIAPDPESQVLLAGMQGDSGDEEIRDQLLR